MYPLRFQPVFKHYVWGGHRLAGQFKKPIEPRQTCAESWEIVDRAPNQGGEQSVVAFGPLAGLSLHELTVAHGSQLLGRHAPQSRFPLLIKLLDAAQPLSVQVHPNDAQAALLVPPDFGKTEAWVVLHAEQEATIHAGLKQDIDQPAFERAMQNGDCEACLHQLRPRLGDCLFLPPGTVHALGAGLVVAEIQQSSDVTYRLFDWNRRGNDGSPRPLHVAEALEVIDFNLGPRSFQTPIATESEQVERLVACDHFVIDRWQLDQPRPIGGDNRLHLLVVLAGAVNISGDPAGVPLSGGEVALLPAELGPVNLTPLPAATLLDVYLP
jgi:mannose-6-phosphate isomerase